MRYSALFLTFSTMAMTGCQSAVIDFERLSSVTTTSSPQPVAVGDSFPVGTTLIDNDSRVELVVLPFRWNRTTPPVWTHDGSVNIVHDDKAGGAKSTEIHLNNACLGIVAPKPVTIKKLVLRFGDHGGNINLIENGIVHHPEDFAGITSSNLVVTVLGGNSSGELTLSGDMKQFYFAPPNYPVRGYSAVIGGGQELWIDDLEFEYVSAP